MIVYIENRGRAGFYRNGKLSHYTMTPASKARIWRVCRDSWHAGAAEARILTSMTAFVFLDDARPH